MPATAPGDPPAGGIDPDHVVSLHAPGCGSLYAWRDRNWFTAWTNSKVSISPCFSDLMR